MNRTVVALAHDYLTQRGGAERVVLDMMRAFPAARVHTTLFDAVGTFPEFAGADLRASMLNRVAMLRRHHRLALPVLAPAVSRMRVEADVVLASSSGWAHGVVSDGRKIVYCHAPARWLYQGDRYLGAARDATATRRERGRRFVAHAALGALAAPLRRWDRHAALSADRYLANSTVTRDAVRDVYGIDAQVVPPPPALLPDGPDVPYPSAEPGFLLCVARLLPYKNVDVVIEAVRSLPEQHLVVVGDGPDRARLEHLTRDCGRILVAGRVSDEQLRWLYRHCAALVAASYEDYGLSPLEAAAFGRPAVVLRAGGFLDTVVEGRTGTFFDAVDADALAAAVETSLRRDWDPATLTEHAESFSAPRFHAALRTIVDDELRRYTSRRT